MPDGKRFLVITPPLLEDTGSITVVLNWSARLTI
jgi:hypothetical protein